MRIDTTKQYAGVPALTVRDLMRRARRDENSWTPADLADQCKTAPTDAAAFVATLVEAGLLVQVTEDNEASAPPCAIWALGEFVLTDAGVAFGNAKAGAVKRTTAAKALEALLNRAAEINADPEATHHVREIVLFGSYLHGTEDTVGDVDLAVELVRVRESRAGSISDLFGEEDAVARRLRNRSRTISIVDLLCHRRWLADKPHKQVFFDASVRRMNERAA